MTLKLQGSAYVESNRNGWYDVFAKGTVAHTSAIRVFSTTNKVRAEGAAEFLRDNDAVRWAAIRSMNGE